MRNREEVFQTVKGILVDVLCREESEIVPTARFFPDLGGESIELLETQFQIEKKLRIKVDFQKMWDENISALNEDGSLTSESLQRLQSAMPYLNYPALPANPNLRHLAHELLTVDAIVEITWRACNAALRADCAATAAVGAATDFGKL